MKSAIAGKKGELSFESIIGLAFLAVFLTTIMAVYQFKASQNPEQVEVKDVIVSYNLILETIRNDVKFADAMTMTPDGVDLLEKDKLMISYRFINGSFYRTDINGKGSILISKLEKATFRSHPTLKKLLMITLLPHDKMQIPFFTSFALRGNRID